MTATSNSFPGFRKSTAHQRMVGFLARSPEFVSLDPMDVLADDDMRHYFMLYLMSTRCGIVTWERAGRVCVCGLWISSKAGCLTHPFAYFVGARRKHATLRCYLDMERFVKPRVHELEALLKNADVDSEGAKRVRMWGRTSDKTGLCMTDARTRLKTNNGRR